MKFNYLILMAGILCLLITGMACHSKSKQMADQIHKGDTNVSEPQPVEPKVLDQDNILTQNEIDEITKQLRPVFFDFDRSYIRQDQVDSLTNNSMILKKYSNVKLLLEGHCDERGTEEYNLALGERRAKAVRDYLIDLGVEDSRIQTISYGESQPFAYDHNESAWQQNRRGQPVALNAFGGESAN